MPIDKSNRVIHNYNVFFGYPLGESFLPPHGFPNTRRKLINFPFTGSHWWMTYDHAGVLINQHPSSWYEGKGERPVISLLRSWPSWRRGREETHGRRKIARRYLSLLWHEQARSSMSSMSRELIYRRNWDRHWRKCLSGPKVFFDSRKREISSSYIYIWRTIYK